MRIVSLCPSLTELVFELGAGDALIGRTKFCIHPAGRVHTVERLGGTKNPRIDRIVALRPDLVLMNAEENRQEDASALVAAGMKIHATMPVTPEDTADMVLDIGAEIGCDENARSIASDIRARADRVRRAAHGRPIVGFACLIWREPWMAVNADTFMSQLLTLAGGRNVYGDLDQRYPTIALESLRETNPRVVVMSSEPFPFAERHAAELVQALGWSRDRFVLADGELLSWHGSRTPRGIDYAEVLIDAARRVVA